MLFEELHRMTDNKATYEEYLVLNMIYNYGKPIDTKAEAVALWERLYGKNGVVTDHKNVTSQKVNSEEYLREYKRSLAIEHNVPLLYEDFLVRINKPHSEAAAYAFECMRDLYYSEPMSLSTLYNHRFAWVYYSWVDRPEIENNKYAENTCPTIISRDKAIEVIHLNLGFDKRLIRIAGTAYYEATDWNYIRFAVRGWAFVFQDDSLYVVIM
jgi:hypothetical protein